MKSDIHIQASLAVLSAKEALQGGSSTQQLQKIGMQARKNEEQRGYTSKTLAHYHILHIYNYAITYHTSDT